MIKQAGRPLSGYRFLQSADVEDVRDRVAQVYCRHQLDPLGRDRRVDAWQNIAKLSRLSVGAMSYGGDVRIDPGRLETFFLAMLPYAGRAQVQSGGQQVLGDTSTATLLSPTDDVLMRWGADCSKLMVRIERESLEQRLAQLMDRPLRQPLRFDVAMPMAAGVTAWWQFVRLLVAEVEQFGTQRAATVAQMESLLLTSLLEMQPHNYADALRADDRQAAPGHVRRVERYIETHAERPIDISDLVAAGGVSGRAIYEGFRRFRDTSPMAYLRLVRLRRAREDLLAGGPDVTVASVATRWYFFELGRFAGQYRALYGETPSQTLRRRA